MRVSLVGIGIAAPGFEGWEAARRVLGGEAAYVHAPLAMPAVQAMPATERRRAGASTRLAIGVAQQAVAAAGVDLGTLASVFASADGDSDNLHQICLALAGVAPEMSPTRFHNSVQNAASGYWSIAMQSRAPTTTLNGLEGVFATALLEAAAQVVAEGRDVLVIACDLPMPPPLHALHPLAEGAGVALVLRPAAAPGTLAVLDLALVSDPAARATRHDDGALELMRTMNPALRSLPLLRSIARSERATVVLDLDDAQRLQIDVASAPARDIGVPRDSARA
jgi:hypothetical protein